MSWWQDLGDDVDDQPPPAPTPRAARRPATARPRHSTTHDARARFVSCAQSLLRRLVDSDTRVAVESARAERAKQYAMREANKCIEADVKAGRCPNVGRALCAALSMMEAGTNAMDLDDGLSPDVEARVIAACGDFFTAHLSTGSAAGRPSNEALALALLYMLREGIPGRLAKNNFLATVLPELGRLRNYGVRVALYTQGKLYVQCALERD